MLKFFRNIRQELIFQGKSMKYLHYALGEVLIVIIGILIAINVNNWNEKQKNSRLEKLILENLFKELKVNLEQLDVKINDCQGHIVKDSVLISYVGLKKPKIEAEELDTLLSFAFPTFDPANGVMNNLFNSGQINLIQNEELKFILSSWESNLNDVKEIEGFIKEFYNNKYSAYLDDKVSQRNKEQNLFGSSTFSWDTKSILADKVFENYLFKSRGLFKFLETRYMHLKGEMIKMASIIEEELN